MSNATDDMPDAATRFDIALSRLEVALAASVTKIAEMAKRTGHEDGRKEALAELAAQTDANTPDLSPLLREELDAARAREAALQDAVTSARAALSEAMDDIRTVLGPV